MSSHNKTCMFLDHSVFLSLSLFLSRQTWIIQLSMFFLFSCFTVLVCHTFPLTFVSMCCSHLCVSPGFSLIRRCITWVLPFLEEVSSQHFLFQVICLGYTFCRFLWHSQLSTRNRFVFHFACYFLTFLKLFSLGSLDKNSLTNSCRVVSYSFH